MGNDSHKLKKIDFKQEFLEWVKNNYGSQGAIVMDDTLKTQKKQIEEAMLEGGMTANDIAKSQGINIQQKPASSPFGFGGLKMQGDKFIEQKPGLLASLLGLVFTGTPTPGAAMDYRKLKALTELQQSPNAKLSPEQVIDVGQKMQSIMKQRGLEGFAPGVSAEGQGYLQPYTSEQRIDYQQQSSKELALYKSQLPTAEMKNMNVAVENQLLNIQDLRTQAEDISGGWGGVFDYAKGVATRGEMNANQLMYMRQIPAISAGLYRALTGDNRLSDRDASERAKPLVWDVTLSDKLKKPMFDRLEKAFKIRKKLLESRIYPTNELGNKQVPWEDIMTELKKDSVNKQTKSSFRVIGER